MTGNGTSAAGSADTVTSLEGLLQLAVDVVKEGVVIARDPGSDLQVSVKSNRNDLVTVVDQRVEERIAERLLAATGYPLLGEEGHGVDTWDGRVWVLDPVDGTMNYVETHRDYAISLALCEDGVPVLGVVMDVVADRCYTALRGGGAWCNGQEMIPVTDDRGFRDSVIITDLKEMRALPRLTRCLEESRGHRRYGSAALECVEVAAGRAGAFVHMWVSPWDIAAACLICTELDVLFTRLDGTPLDLRWKGSVLVAPATIHRELLHRLMIDAQ